MVEYPLTVFLSAFLLFLIQPLMGKVLLPWYGGTSAVWSAVVFFFQVLLLLGYAYSHAVSRLPRRRQSRVHVIVLGVSLLALLLQTALTGWETPITPGPGWQPGPAEVPILRLVATLTVAVGLPYLVLSTTSSLLQSWFGRKAGGARAYRLYAISNAGSLLALVCYPFVLEPLLSLRSQAVAWVGGYVLFVGLCAYVAFGLRKASPRAGGGDGEIPAPIGDQDEPAPKPSRRWLWLVLSACPSLLLLAVTHRMTQDVAALPFLWVLPLALYLTSFILPFANFRWYSRWFFAGLFLATFLYCWTLIEGNRLHILTQLGIHAFLLLMACWICHGELVRLRPGPRGLTGFYLWVALGGALGGVLVNLVTPLVFDNTWELPLGLIGCWVLLLMAWQVDKGSPLYGRMFLSVLLLWALAVAWLAFVTYQYVRSFHATALEANRNFYGVTWIRERRFGEGGDLIYELGHGVSRHGSQFVAGSRRLEPTSYYCPDGGGGLALAHFPRQGEGLRVGVVGLGVGTLVTYGQPKDLFRFYEINPRVIQVAQGMGGYFSFLEMSAATVEIVPGDARLSMERELAEGRAQGYDVLLLDAFNSHAIPVHLLTRESFAVYQAHLAENGVLAFHVSNPHLDLEPVLGQLAAHFGLRAVAVESPGDGQACDPALWVLIGRHPPFFATPEIAEASRPVEDDGGRLRLWTDDYSNLFQIVD